MHKFYFKKYTKHFVFLKSNVKWLYTDIHLELDTMSTCNCTVSVESILLNM